MMLKDGNLFDDDQPEGDPFLCNKYAVKKAAFRKENPPKNFKLSKREELNFCRSRIEKLIILSICETAMSKQNVITDIKNYLKDKKEVKRLKRIPHVLYNHKINPIRKSGLFYDLKQTKLHIDFDNYLISLVVAKIIDEITETNVSKMLDNFCDAVKKAYKTQYKHFCSVPFTFNLRKFFKHKQYRKWLFKSSCRTKLVIYFSSELFKQEFVKPIMETTKENLQSIAWAIGKNFVVTPNSDIDIDYYCIDPSDSKNIELVKKFVAVGKISYRTDLILEKYKPEYEKLVRQIKTLTKALENEFEKPDND